MMIMQPPQQGQEWAGGCVGSVSFVDSTAGGPGPRAYARPQSFWCDCRWRAGHSDGCGGNPWGERAHDFANEVSGHLVVARRCVGLGMAEQPRAIMRTFYVTETKSSVGWNPMIAGAACACVRDTQPCPAS